MPYRVAVTLKIIMWQSRINRVQEIIIKQKGKSIQAFSLSDYFKVCSFIHHPATPEAFLQVQNISGCGL